MAHQSLNVAYLALALSGCPKGPAPLPPVVTPDGGGPVTFSEDPSKWPAYHSTRFGMTIPLPDGKAWKIDDHSSRELVAFHAATGSVVRLYVWHETELMNRARCETRARELALVPDDDSETIDSQVVAEPTLKTNSANIPDIVYDTRIWIGVLHRTAGDAGPGGTTAHLMAYGASVRKCLFFHFQTQAADGDEQVISSRLALARVRIFGGLKLDSIGEVQREPLPH